MYIRTYIHTYAHMYIHTRSCANLHAYILTCMHSDMHACMHIFTSYVRTCVSTCINVCTYAHTHIQPSLIGLDREDGHQLSGSAVDFLNTCLSPNPRANGLIKVFGQLFELVRCRTDHWGISLGTHQRRLWQKGSLHDIIRWFYGRVHGKFACCHITCCVWNASEAHFASHLTRADIIELQTPNVSNNEHVKWISYTLDTILCNKLLFSCM